MLMPHDLVISLLSTDLQTFLNLYQVDKPMMPFLVPDLLKLVKDLLAHFVNHCNMQ